MLIRLRLPHHVKLSQVFEWTKDNSVPVIFRERVIHEIDPEDPDKGYFELDGDLVSRHRLVSRSEPKQIDVPYEVKRVIGLCRYQLVAKPDDAPLLAVRFGLTSDVD